MMGTHFQLVVGCDRGAGNSSTVGAGTCLGPSFFGRLSVDKFIEIEERGAHRVQEVKSRKVMHGSICVIYLHCSLSNSMH